MGELETQLEQNDSTAKRAKKGLFLDSLPERDQMQSLLLEQKKESNPFAFKDQGYFLQFSHCNESSFVAASYDFQMLLGKVARNTYKEVKVT